MLNQLKLGAKFNLLLVSVYLLGSLTGGFVLSQVLQEKSEAKVVSEALVMINTINAQRLYTDQQVRPLLENAFGTDQFIAETVPSYGARRVFENLQRLGFEFKQKIYKEAVLDPTNPDDRADEFETELTARFAADESLEELSGFRQVRNIGSIFYIAYPIRIRRESCLICHSTPDVAPRGMVEVYGPNNGFNWQIGSTIGAQMVYIPAQQIFSQARQSFLVIMAIFLVMFAIALIALNRVLNSTVIKPIQILAQASQLMGAGKIKTEEDVDNMEFRRLSNVMKQEDELGQLSRIFQTMINKIIEREQKLRQQIRQLTIEIDQSRKAKEVSEIVESDFFKNLQRKAKSIRQRDPNLEPPEEENEDIQ
ncbi:MAG: DUF3365 domain-containing protein [Cyanobacteriota bacterium]